MDIFDTRVLMETLRLTQPVGTFFLDTFFSRKLKQFHNTNTLEIDVVVGKRVLAPYVRACDEHKPVDRGGGETRSVKTPYIKLKRNVSICCDLLKRQPGESVYSTRTPQQRAQEILVNDNVELRDMIIRREEWQAAQALLTGKSNIRGDDYNDIVDFRMPAAHIIDTLSGAALWSNAASNPLAALRGWRSMVTKSSGTTPTVLVGGTAAIEAFLGNAEVQKAISSTSGLNAGSLNLNAAAIDGVISYGNVAGFSVYQYNENYYDPEADIDGEIMPTDRILIGSPTARCERHYGVIQDFAAGNPEVDYFAKTWDIQDPSIRYLGIQSAPLAIPFQPDGFVSVKVV
jgi:hypothetical protein